VQRAFLHVPAKKTRYSAIRACGVETAFENSDHPQIAVAFEHAGGDGTDGTNGEANAVLRRSRRHDMPKEKNVEKMRTKIHTGDL
jgi:hypothetical protein